MGWADIENCDPAVVVDNSMLSAVINTHTVERQPTLLRAHIVHVTVSTQFRGCPSVVPPIPLRLSLDFASVPQINIAVLRVVRLLRFTMQEQGSPVGVNRCVRNILEEDA